MKFAFMIHPLSAETSELMDLELSPEFRASWGNDALSACSHLRNMMEENAKHHDASSSRPTQSRVVDELSGLVSAMGCHAEGRLYEIPMDTMAILNDPGEAVRNIEEAAAMATDWGAEIIGLGSMTGIVGGNGTHLAEQSPAAVTTGNSLTVYAALQNLRQACNELQIDLQQETVAVVGVPGSIAAAIASLLRDECESLLLVGRRASRPATKLAEKLDAELILDIDEAMGRASIIVTATSSGQCISQSALRPGTVVVDIAVPADVRGDGYERNDVLILSGGLTQIPDSMPRNSRFLWFHHGMIPSCLAETMVLALESRPECLSLGKTLNLESIREIGAIAEAHGFSFSELYSFGHPIDTSRLIQLKKHRRRSVSSQHTAKSSRPTAFELAEQAADRYARHINPVLIAAGASSDFIKTFVRGEGTYLYDADGGKYLDFVSGFGSLNLGHNHPSVVQAVETAMQANAPGFCQSAVNPYAAALADELVSLAPDNLEMVFFSNSGTEAVEAALKLARAATGRSGFLYCERSFHGKSLGSLSVTGNPDYQGAFGPLLPGCESIPYGDYDALDRALASRRFAGLIVEPIQGEGGIIPAQAGYLREAQSICRSQDTLLIVDEVQTGMGRAGSLFAVDQQNVTPDILTLAKSLGGGVMPIGATLSRRDLWLKAYGTLDTFARHTSTFGGNSLSCAAGLAALAELSQPDLLENVRARSHQLLGGLQQLCDHFSFLREVRGQGLLLGLEFEPLPHRAAEHWKSMGGNDAVPFLVPNFDRLLASMPVVYTMQSLLQTHHIYSQMARSNPQVLRIQPPLIINESEVNLFLEALAQTCQEFEFALKLTDGVIARSGTGQLEVSRDNEG